MKRLRYLFCIAAMFTFLATHASDSEQTFDPDYIPLAIQDASRNYVAHFLQDHNNHRLLIADLKAILKNESSDGLCVSQHNDFFRWYRCVNSYSKYMKELFGAAHLALAAHYFAIGLDSKAEEVLPDGKMDNGYLQVKDGTLFTDYVSALGNYTKYMERVADVFDGKKYSYHQRVTIIQKIFESYACFQRGLHNLPYDYKQTKGKTISAAYKPANYMLLDALLAYQPLGMPYVSKTGNKPLNSFYEDLVTLSQKSISEFLEECIIKNYEESRYIPYFYRFLFDSAIEPHTRSFSDLSTFSILHILYRMGYTPAFIEMGARIELGKYDEFWMKPMVKVFGPVSRLNEALKFYNKAYDLDCQTAVIPLAHGFYKIGSSTETKETAFSLLKSHRDDEDFPKYGAYALASLLMDKELNAKYDPGEVLALFSQAAQSSFDEKEREMARKMIDSLYEKYFK